MAHYDIFRHHLLNKFPAYGHALWDPNPGNLYPAVEVGDVGYIRNGKFRRLFNVLLPASHPSHRNFGVPEYHEQLTLDIEDHIDIGTLSPHNFYSAGVTLGLDSDRWADGPREPGEVSFSCPVKEGAVLCLPIEAKREDTVADTTFGKWIVKNIDRWFAWARQRELGVNRMEDIVLVTGTHRTRSCTNVAFPGGQGDAQVSFGAKVDHRSDVVAINWKFSHERNRGAVLNCGPSGEGLPEHQCIFVRGFRVARKFKILPRLKAAAEPNPDPDPDGFDEHLATVELVPIPALPEYQDPLHILLEFVAEEAPSCDMVLVHDNDLAQLDGICDSEDTPLESLQLDALSSRLRTAKPRIQNISFGPDVLPADNSASDAPDIVWVATLSTIFEKRLVVWNKSPQSYGESLATSLRSLSVLVDKSLLVDGYVSHTFKARRAQKYFFDVLKSSWKSSSLPQITTTSYFNREGYFFIVDTRGCSFDMPFRFLDRAVVSRGTVIAQTMWSPDTLIDKRQHVEEAVLQTPIFFEGINGRLGLSLEDAAAGRCRGLRDAQQFAPLGYKSTTHIRIGWPGYQNYKRQVQIRDETSEHNPITISRFAHHVGRSVDAFLKACEPNPGYTDDIKRRQWRIGGPDGIQRSDIIVIGAIQVAAGSWMPLLQLNRYIL